MKQFWTNINNNEPTEELIVCRLPYILFLQTRENFKSSRDDIQALMRKMLEVRQTVSRISSSHVIMSQARAGL